MLSWIDLRFKLLSINLIHTYIYIYIYAIVLCQLLLIILYDIIGLIFQFSVLLEDGCCSINLESTLDRKLYQTKHEACMIYWLFSQIFYIHYGPIPLESQLRIDDI